METESVRISEPGTLTMPDVAWDRTKQISAVIAPLAARALVGGAVVDEAARALGVSRRQIYVLIKRHRDGSGLLTDMAPGAPAVGRGLRGCPRRSRISSTSAGAGIVAGGLLLGEVPTAGLDTGGTVGASLAFISLAGITGYECGDWYANGA